MKNKIDWIVKIETQRRYIQAIKNFESFNIFQIKKKNENKIERKIKRKEINWNKKQNETKTK